MNVPPFVAKWGPVVARLALTGVIIVAGVRMWLDGYSGLAVTVGGGLLTAELIGLGLSPKQAAAVLQDVHDVAQGKPPTVVP